MYLIKDFQFFFWVSYWRSQSLCSTTILHMVFGWMLDLFYTMEPFTTSRAFVNYRKSYTHKCIL